LLILGYLPFARDVFADPTASDTLAPGFLLAFSATRSFLCLAFIVTLTSYAVQYWNRPSPLNQKLAGLSYNIYMVHLIFVIILQELLTLWPGGPPMAKAGIVLLLGLLISIGISSLIKRFPRGFVAFLVALFVFVAVVTW
jgi:peptidoglycan/LPS O-acetylase OafA/YrhL